MKKLFLFSVLMLLPMLASADAVEINGIYYNLLEGAVAEVTKMPNDGKYSGSVVIPESVIYEGKTYSVTSIGRGAFSVCSGLTPVTIPNSVTSIGNYAFAGCSGLTSVTIPNRVKSIGEGAFSGCSGLSSIKVENGNPNYDSRNNCNAIIETSSNRLIAGCMNTIIPNGVTLIGSGVFVGCSGLTSVTIPNSVTTIGNAAFFSCSGLTSVTIPNSVTSIGMQTFVGCRSLNSVTIPNSVTTIGEWAFADCSGLTEVISKIQNPFVIDDNVFEGISRNAILQVPTGEKSKYEAFSGWTKNFKEIVEAEGNNTSTKRTIHVAAAGTLPNLISEAEKYDIEELTLTGELNGTDFRLLRDMAGNNYLGQDTEGRLTVLDLSNATIVAGGEKYLDTSSIKGNGGSISGNHRYSILDNNEIPQFAFYACDLKIASIPNSVTSIGYFAFGRCIGLTSVTISNSVTSIGDDAFYKCSGLTSVTIPSSVTSIGNQAFDGCSGLTSITIPNSVASIGGGAFAWCSGLTSMTIPNSVSSIGRYAFQYCSALTSVTIPNSVTSIGDGAFNGCSGLTEVKSMIQEPYEINQNCWKDVNTDIIPLYVPKGTKSLYEATTGWNVFKNIIEMDDLLDSVEENGGVDFGGEDGPGEDSNLNGNVIGNIYYSIDDNNGEYSSEEGCIILKKPTSDEEMENLEGQDIFGEDFNENFTGIVFMVSPGSGTIKVNAESVGNMTLKVKIGDGAPMTFELEGKMKASFPYSVTEPTYVYIYGGETDSNNARSVRSVGENALKIYGIEWTNDPSGIDDIRVNTKAVIYNINGQRVQTTGKGLYIMNGKKVVMK